MRTASLRAPGRRCYGEKGRSLSNIPKISIVDDDRSFREATRRLMKSAGYDVSLFESAEAYLSSDRVRDSACLILDMNMPGLSGFELQQHLIAEGDRTPVILVSAIVEEKTKSAVLAAGAVGFLHKPFGERTLLEHIDEALRRTGCKAPGHRPS
jgi:FixJ family two-component response regulator